MKRYEIFEFELMEYSNKKQIYYSFNPFLFPLLVKIVARYTFILVRNMSRVQEGSTDDISGKVQSKGFQMMVHGVVNGAECLETTQLFVRTHLFFGADWSFMKPTNDGSASFCDSDVMYPTYNNNAEIITQLSDRAFSAVPYFAFSAPFEFALQSTNPYGWPQMVVTLHSMINKPDKSASMYDGGAQGVGEAVVGYGRCFIPMESGYHTKKVKIMQLHHSTRKDRFIGALIQEKPVLRDLSYLCRGDDRVVLAARPLSSYVDLSFTVVLNGLEACGFNS